MILQELIKILLPWLLIAFWLIHIRAFKRQKVILVTLYITVFSGFSSNFTPFYREVGQGISLLMGGIALARVYERKAIPAFAGAILGFFFFIVISAVFNWTSGISWDAIINFATVSLVATLIVSDLREEDRRIAFFEYFIRIAALISIVAIVEALVTGGRAEATFSNTNYLAFFLGVASCMVVHRQSDGRRWALFILIALGIFFTKSRAGLVFPLAAMVFYTVSFGMRRLVAVAPLLLLAIWLVITVMPEPSVGLGRDVEGSNAERRLAIEAGLEMVRENPLAGVGWGRFTDEFRDAASRAPVVFSDTLQFVVRSHRDMVSHNDLIRVFSELGIFAGIYFIFLIGLSVRGILFMPSSQRSIFFSALFGSIFFSLTHNNLNSALFWVVLLYPIAHGVRLPRRF